MNQSRRKCVQLLRSNGILVPSAQFRSYSSLRGFKLQSTTGVRNGICLVDMKHFGTETKKEDKPNNDKRVLVYEAKYGKKMVLLRRVSLFSSFLTIPLIAATFVLETDAIPLTAQLAVIGTVLFSSLSSTAMLHFVGSPYVIRMYEMIGDKRKHDREFIAITTGIYGQFKEIPFKMSQAIKPAVHPFGSFRLANPNKNLYVYGGKTDDLEIKQKLTKEG